HPRDTDKLVSILGDLAARGNTVVVVEHEPLVMRAADSIVDLGPGAGEQGGRLLYAGRGGEAVLGAATETARYLSGGKRIERRRAPGASALPQASRGGRGRHAGRRGAPGIRAGARAERVRERSGGATATGGFLTVTGATHHNLRDVTVRVPFGRLTAVT